MSYTPTRTSQDLATENNKLRSEVERLTKELNLITDNRWTELELELAEISGKVMSMKLRSGMSLEDLYTKFDVLESGYREEIIQRDIDAQKLEREVERLRKIEHNIYSAWFDCTITAMDIGYAYKIGIGDWEKLCDIMNDAAIESAKGEPK